MARTTSFFVKVLIPAACMLACFATLCHGAPFSIGQVKELPEGSKVSIEDAVVTASELATGVSFIESSDRSSGIMISIANQLSSGDRVTFSGRVCRIDGERQLSDIEIKGIEHGAPISPLFMKTRTIGNDQAETLDYRGIDTTGLLVKVCGKVTYRDQEHNVIYIDDGGTYQDGISGPAPRMTSLVKLGGNLEQSTLVGFLWKISFPIYDSKGKVHLLGAVFVKTANTNEWSYTISSDESTPQCLATGTLTFGSDGKCLDEGVEISMTPTAACDGLWPMYFHVSFSDITCLVGVSNTLGPVEQDGLPPAPSGLRVQLPAGVDVDSIQGRVVSVTGISRVEKHILSTEGCVNGEILPAGSVVYVPSVWARDASDMEAQAAIWN